MEINVKIIWDKPEEQAWLCPDNIAVALSEHCKNTKFKVEEIELELIDGEIEDKAIDFTNEVHGECDTYNAMRWNFTYDAVVKMGKYIRDKINEL